MRNTHNRILEMTAWLLTFSFITPLMAQTCETPPSCEILGYTKTADDCSNKVTLKCPLDESKLYCADAKQSGVCSGGYSEIEKIIPYCTGSNARLIYDSQNPNCAKCQKCGSTSSLAQVSGCCPDWLASYESQDGCAGGKKYNSTDSNGCWTCSKCRNQYSLNPQGLCVDPSYIEGVKKYAVGDTYSDSNGIGIGKVVQITDNGTHGLIAVSGGEGTLSHAQSTCNNKRAGGLDWALGGAAATCQTVHQGMSSLVHHHGTQLTSNCFSSLGGHCAATDTCSFACEAHF